MDSTALLGLKGQHVGYYKKAVRSRKNFSKTRELKWEQKVAKSNKIQRLLHKTRLQSKKAQAEWVHNKYL